MKVKARSSQALLIVAVALVAVISIAAVAVGATSEDTASSGSSAVVIEASSSSLTDFEIEGILFMREEEKLAYDVYMTFADLYGQPIFSNIASAETQHMAAVLGLIEAYDLDDPVDDSPIGVFVNEDLQALYDGLIADGSVDVAAALEVGAVIEEVDILDLEKYLDGTTNPDIIRVYDNLLRGSENHLRAFVSQLEATSVNDRVPALMDQTAYDEILAAQTQRGDSAGAGHGDGECDESGEGQHDEDMHGQGRGGMNGQGQGGQGKHGQGQHGQGG